MVRPEKPIDWKKVDQLLMAGCSGTEIAPHFDIHYDTLYDRVKLQYGISFTEYSSKLRQKGDALLKAVQFEKALSKDNTMMIWLGKNRLGQKETHENLSVPNDKALTELIQEVKQLKDKVNATQHKADSEL